MKKIGMFTLDSRIYNYGGLLQEYALFETLTSLGVDPEIIDYEINSEIYTFSYKRNLRFLTPEKIVDRILCHLNSNSVAEKTALPEQSKELFDVFRNERLHLSERIAFENLKDLSKKYDGFVCGSDQIWNPSYNIPSFFLNFTEPRQTRVIYAASLGVSELTSVQRNEYARLLTFPDAISVREKDAVDLIQPLTEKKVELVLDPTLLLPSSVWKELAGEPENKASYVFCYFLGMDKEKVDAAKAFAEKHHLQIIAVPFQNQKYQDDIFSAYHQGVGPIEFLKLIRYATFVLTDSFHATVFSVLFQRPFRVFPRDLRKNGMNGRIQTLLSYIEKKSYMISPQELHQTEILGDCNSDLYDLKEIEILRDKSRDWLERVLNNE